jgi:hypothetical protein
VRTVDASAPISIGTVETRIDESLVGERLITVIAAFLGMVSLVLACGALGGLMSHLVATRTREIGLRLALGAERRLVLGLRHAPGARDRRARWHRRPWPDLAGGRLVAGS